MRPPRLLLSAFLAGALFMAGCGDAPSDDTVQTGSPEPETGVLDPLDPDPDTAAAPDTDSAPDNSPAPDTAPAAIPEEDLDEAAPDADPDTGRSEPESAADETPGPGETPTPAQRDDNQAGTDAPVQETCSSVAAAPGEVRIVEATVTPALFVFTEQGQSFTAEVLVELSGPTSEAPPAAVDTRGIRPVVALSISDPECAEPGTVWRWVLTASHPGRITFPPGFALDSAVAFLTPDGQRLAVPFTIEYGTPDEQSPEVPFTVEFEDSWPVGLDAREFLAGRLGVATDKIEIAKVESVTFNDGSLGCAQEGYAYTQAEVPGFIITLTHGASVHVVHTNEHGGHFVVPENCVSGGWSPR